MKKIIVSLTLILALLAGQATTFARVWNGWGQDGDIFIAMWQNEYKDISQKPMLIGQDVPEKGGPMLDDEYTLLVPIDISQNFGYETTEDNDNITIKHDKRTIVIHKNENKAEVDGKTIDLFHKQANNMTYVPYKSLETLFDVDLEWDAENLYLLITERATTPVSERQKKFRQYSISLGTATPAPTPAAKPSEITYTDCDNEKVAELTEMEILSGDGDGKFRPNDTLTRAEFATMIAKASGIDYMGIMSLADESIFPDVALGFWGEEYIRFCVAKGIIEGFEDGNFKPNENVTFAQVVKICLSAVNYNNFITSDSDTWYKSWLEAAETYGLTDTKGKDPDKNISRLEAAELIYSMMDLPLCVMVGTKIVDGIGVPEFALSDGKTTANGNLLELQTLRMQNFDWYKKN